MFGNSYFPPYPGYQPPGQRPSAPIPTQNPAPMMQYQLPNMPTVMFSHGEVEATACHVLPGNTVYIFDLDRPVFYIKSVDAAGIPQPMQYFDYSPRNSAGTNQLDAGNFATLDMLNALAGRVAALEAKPPEPKIMPMEVQNNAVSDS